MSQSSTNTDLNRTPPSIARRLVVGDLHGDWQRLLTLLCDVGAIDEQGVRREGWWLMQIGDLIHGGHHQSGDERCLEEGLRLFDVLILGNHELPHAFPGARLPAFVGQTPLTSDAQARLDAAVCGGRYAVAAAVDGWLLTHAGLHPALARAASLPTDAEDCARELNARFARRVTTGRLDPLFDAVGPARGGRSAIGGIFWLDWRELVEVADENRIPQVVGHTPRPNGPERHGANLWCVDVGAALSTRVCALLKENSESDWQPIVV